LPPSLVPLPPAEVPLLPELEPLLIAPELGPPLVPPELEAAASLPPPGVLPPELAPELEAAESRGLVIPLSVPLPELAAGLQLTAKAATRNPWRDHERSPFVATQP
jgi:hypothetical protein